MKDAGSKPSSVILVEITSPYSSFPSPKSVRAFVFSFPFHKLSPLKL